LGVVDDERRGIALGVGAYLVWGFLTIYWKALHGLNAFQLIGARIISSFVLLAAFLAFTRRWRGLDILRRDRSVLGLVAAAAVLLTANWTGYVWAVVHDDVIQTALGYFIAPLGTVLIGVLVLREHLRPAQKVAVGLAVLAMVQLTLAYGRVPVIALIIAASWAFYGLLKRRIPMGAFEGLTGETLVLLLPAVAVVALPAVAGHGLATQGSTGQMVLVALSGVATTAPLLMFAGAARRVPFTLLGPMQYIVPTINFLLGAFVYHEPLAASQVVGFALVWVGLIIFTVDSVRSVRTAPAEATPATVAT
jgi:chloramphenicol-sensitive protein RarD